MTARDDYPTLAQRDSYPPELSVALDEIDTLRAKVARLRAQVTEAESRADIPGDWENLVPWVEHVLQGRDPLDYLPWTFTLYRGDLINPDDPPLGSISTPNGRRPDGATHTYWSVVHNVWSPTGEAICAIVNEIAYRSGLIPRAVAARPVNPEEGT